ncbi:MAG: hypothetical protein NVS1B2_01340 [Vulcanimicrobiaceae bacterium]
MQLGIVDDYLLGEPVPKGDVVTAFLAERSPVPAAAPFYRALEAVGVRAADEAFVALRLVLAGRHADDAGVARVRALTAVARSARRDDGAALVAVLRRERAVLGPIADMPTTSAGDIASVAVAARQAYRRELSEGSSGERNAGHDSLR